MMLFEKIIFFCAINFSIAPSILLRNKSTLSLLFSLPPSTINSIDLPCEKGRICFLYTSFRFSANISVDNFREAFHDKNFRRI